MADYEEIQDSEVEPGAPLISRIGFRLRDNAIAIAQGAAGAPRVQTDALNDSAVTQPKLAAGAAGRAEIKMGTNSVSGSLNAGSQTTIDLNDYSLFPSLGSSSRLSLRASGGSSSAANPRFNLRNEVDSPRTYEVAWRFIQA